MLLFLTWLTSRAGLRVGSAVIKTKAVLPNHKHPFGFRIKIVTQKSTKITVYKILQSFGITEIIKIKFI